MDTVQGGQIIRNGDAAGNLTSLVVDIQSCVTAGVQLYSESGTRDGEVQIQESIDGQHWVPITFSDDTQAIDVVAGQELSQLKNLSGLGGQYLRVVYVASAGSGALQCWCIRKPI